jgi:N-acetyl-anhydromuramyl-L-alanine amidase AmpD
MHRSLAAAIAALASALVVAAAATAATPPASGKVDASAPASSGSQHLRNAKLTGAECPNGLACRVMPAAYQQNSADPGDYGNYDLATRPDDGLAIRFVVIHDTEYGYDPTIALFQNPLAYVSSHYVLRSSDGQVTQMVPTQNVAWHAGNWWVNSHAIGIENEGFATEGNTWYTEHLYRSLARLTRYLADRYGIPLDREHIIGHDQVPGPTAFFQPGMHWDPGPYFDWAHLMALAGAPINPSGGDRTGRIVTIDPNFATNRPVVTYCQAGSCQTLPSQPTNFIYLHTAPSESAPLVADPLLSGTNLEPGGVGTTQANDWGDKAVTGQSFAVAGRSGDWVAIWYGGQRAWFEDPAGTNTTSGTGTLVTPKAGVGSIPVYGRAYPEYISSSTLGYTIPAGQVYVAKDLVGADYYDATTFNALDTYNVFTSPTKFYEISFNHRLAFLRADDVDVVR